MTGARAARSGASESTAIDTYPINLRPARPSDIAVCIEIRGRTRENAVSAARLAQVGITAASWSAQVVADTLPGHVAEVAGEIVGYCFGDADTGEVVVLALLPAYEDQGIGKALLRIAMDTLRARGHERLFLGCSADPAHRSHGFYRHLGWRPTGRRDARGDEILEHGSSRATDPLPCTHDEAMDTARIDALVALFFGAFDNRDGATPDLVRLAGCFTEKAVVACRSAAGTTLQTVDEFAGPRFALLTDGRLVEFHEWETSATTRLFDGLATRVSRYAKAGLMEGLDYAGTGTKCFQLVETDAGWRIASLAWVDDRPA